MCMSRAVMFRFRLRLKALARACADSLAAQKQMRLPLTVRCGVHTGVVTGAVVGTVLPRYLVYGPTCDRVRVNELEASAEEGSVQSSAQAAARVNAQAWGMEQRTTAGEGGGWRGEPA